MFCKDCNVVMKTGTTYEQKKHDKDKGWRRYNECPKCHTKIYNNSPNFQETLEGVMEKNKKK